MSADQAPHRAPPEIRQLPEQVANQIAAGEVIERPAAVVKELVENSLDAGATRIVVRCDDGGRRLVEVVDDGHGLRAGDLRRALDRHATSKLHDADDLFRIATLGFRGEALPSIAAVTEFEFASRPWDQDEGAVLAVAGGVESRAGACAMAHGTRVSVRNLFWNVPVRLKFLKSEAAETGHVTEQVIRLALGHPTIAFRLECGDKTILDLPPQESLAVRIRTLFGRAMADSLLSVAATADQLQISGFVAHPREARPTAKRQYVFLNGRHVRDRLLIAAVREGFKGFLEPRLHGAVFLHLDLDPSLVDVNVHPTKSEVRFRREGEVFATVVRAIRGALAENAGGFGLLGGEPAVPAVPVNATAVMRTVVKPALADLPPALQERFLPAVPTTSAQDERADALPARRVADAAPAYTARAPATPATDPHLPGVRRVLQLNDMYLLIETDSGIRLVDQHALHEKALFLCFDPAATDLALGGVQELLVPRAVELGAAEIAVLDPLLHGLTAHGIHAEVFGPTTLLLRAHPVALRRVNWQAFFADLAAGAERGELVGIERLHERLAHRAACHGAIKAGQRLAPEEQLELVRLLYRLEHMEHCPHGRPTTLDLPWGELERRFQR